MSFFLLESGDKLKLESGDFLLLDEAVPPTLTSISPSEFQFVHTGHSFTVSVTLRGTGFDGPNPAVNVPVGWSVANLVIVNAGRATADITVSGDTTAGSYPITFETDSGESNSVSVYVNVAIPYQPDEPRILLPGFGGKLLAVVTTVDVDTDGAESGQVDASRCAQLAIQVTAQSDDGEPFSVQIEQTFDNVNWAALGSPFTAVGQKLKLNITDGPFGKLRAHVSMTDSSSTSSFVGTTVTLTFVGWEIQKGN